MFTSLRARLLIVYLGLSVVGFGALTLWAATQIARSTLSDFGASLQFQAQLLANQLRDPLEENPAALATILPSLAGDLSADIAVFDAAGNVLFATGNSASTPLNGGYTLVGDHVVAAATITEEHRDDDEEEEEEENAEIIGRVQLAVDAATPRAAVSQRQLALAGAFVTLSATGLLLVLWLVGSLTQPLSRLRDAALAIADGDLSRRVSDLPANEIGTVGSAFNEMATRVEAMITEQRAFASNASHELRTPLTVIRLRTEALREGALSAAEADQYIQEIDAEARRMSDLVQDLLLLSRLDADRLEAGLETIDIGRVVRAVVRAVGRDLADGAAEKNVTLTTTMPDEPLTVSAGLSHLRVVLRNVIENAVKYTPVGGSVQVHLAARDETAVLTVTDTGIGIAAEDLPHLGRRFFRADKAHSRATAGTGLGLALVDSIVALYDGDITIESDGLGQGTTVTLSWPLGHA